MRGAADPLAVGQDVVVLVVPGHRPVREREHRAAVGVEGAERIAHVQVHLRGLRAAVELLHLRLRHARDRDDVRLRSSARPTA